MKPRQGVVGAAVAMVIVGASGASGASLSRNDGASAAAARSAVARPAATQSAATRAGVAMPWPGGVPAVADAAGAFGGNVSGLVAAGPLAAGPLLMWAVRDQPSTLLAVARSRSGWAARAGWDGGKPLRYPGGAGEPDAEAVTVSGLDAGAVYVGAERDHERPNVSRNSILRYVVSDAAPLVATHEWQVGHLLPETAANGGIEALAWIPDTVGAGRADASVPAGSIVVAVGTEADGTIRLLALGRDGVAAMVGSIDSGLPAVMSLEWDSERGALWAWCDNGCGGRASVMRTSGADGQLVVTESIAAPSGAARLNQEGFAIVGSCRTGTRRAVWSDDAASARHALRDATMRCESVRATTTAPARRRP